MPTSDRAVDGEVRRFATAARTRVRTVPSPGWLLTATVRDGLIVDVRGDPRRIGAVGDSQLRVDTVAIFAAVREPPDSDREARDEA